MEVTIIRPGDPGFEEIAATCKPPKVRNEEDPPKPIFVEYNERGRVVE